MSSIVVAGDTSGTVTLQAPATAGSVVVTLPAANGTMLTNNSTITPSAGSVNQAALATGVAGTGPAFSAYATANQTISSGVWTKITLDAEDFDTNNNFASSRFTPTVAGYYQVNASVAFAAGSQQDAIAIYKNGAFYRIGTYHSDPGTIGLREIISTLVYCNGSTDYLEVYVTYNAGGATNTVTGGQYNIWFNGSLARAA